MECLPLRLQASSKHVFEDSDGMFHEPFFSACANQVIIREHIGFNALCFHLCCQPETLDQVSFVRQVTQGKVIPADQSGTSKNRPPGNRVGRNLVSVEMGTWIARVCCKCPHRGTASLVVHDWVYHYIVNV